MNTEHKFSLIKLFSADSQKYSNNMLTVTTKIQLFLVLSSLCIICSSCAFRQLKHETKALRSQWSIISEISFEGDETGDLVAVIYKVTSDSKSIISFRIVPWNLKEFVFLLDSGQHDYRLAVFHDKNSDLVIDNDEPVVLANQGNRLKFSNVTTRLRMGISMADASILPADYPRSLTDLPEETTQTYYVSVGAIADLSAEKFSTKGSKQGFWEPHRFLKQHGIGVYMLGPYDPTKIPVLFVSGAGGNIHDWDYFLERLDTSRYQAWYYLYPSGTRITQLGEVLHLIVNGLEEQHDFGELVVIAHHR